VTLPVTRVTDPPEPVRASRPGDGDHGRTGPTRAGTGAPRSVRSGVTAEPVGGGPDRLPEPADVRRVLQSVMTERVGLLRDATGLAGARRELAALTVDAPTTVRAHEDRALLDLARLVARAAEARTESRGAHARTDHPDTDPGAPASLAWARAVAPAPAPVPVTAPAPAPVPEEAIA
jgi:L-aspartate oxidase